MVKLGQGGGFFFHGVFLGEPRFLEELRGAPQSNPFKLRRGEVEDLFSCLFDSFVGFPQLAMKILKQARLYVFFCLGMRTFLQIPL